MTTLVNIRQKVRNVTGRISTNQLSDSDLDEIINNFYLYNLPEKLRLINLKTNYTFNLAPNVAVYNFDRNNYYTVEPPAFLSGYQIQFFQDQQSFYEYNPQIRSRQQLSTGTGVAGPYTGNISATPVQNNSVFISTIDVGGNSMVAQDDGAGNLTGDVIAGGTVNYQTGAISVTWTANAGIGQPIWVQSVNYSVGRPFAVLFFHDQFTFSQWPDIAYPFQIQAYIKPTALAALDSPLLDEWWELLAYGASLKILGDSLDMEGYSKVQLLYDLQEKLAERRTMKQLSTQRARTIFSDYDRYPYSGQYPYV